MLLFGVLGTILLTIVLILYAFYLLTNAAAETTASFLIENAPVFFIVIFILIFLVKIGIYSYYGIKNLKRRFFVLLFIFIDCASQACMIESMILNISESLVGTNYGLILIILIVILSLVLCAIPSAINIGIDINIISILSNHQSNRHSSNYKELDIRFVRHSCIKLFIASIANTILAIFANPYFLAE